MYYFTQCSFKFYPWITKEKTLKNKLTPDGIWWFQNGIKCLFSASRSTSEKTQKFRGCLQRNILLISMRLRVSIHRKSALQLKRIE